MSYTAPTLGPQGLTIPSYSDIRDDLLSQYRNIYGQTVYLGIDSADYQWISALAAKMSDTMKSAQLAYNARSPLTAIGADLDGIVKLNGIARKIASTSTVVLTLTGTPGAIIPRGIVRDVNGFLWDLPTQTTIGGGGSVSVTATAESTGNVNALAGQVTLIATPTAGWISVTNSAPASPGQPVETDAQLRARQSISVALPSSTRFDGTVAAIAATVGVTRYNAIENPTGGVDAFGTPAHSITIVAEGGADLAIAQALFNNRSIGCYTNGTTVVPITDAFTSAVMPMRFSRPVYVPVFVSLSVHPLTGFTRSSVT
jgi:uncharacterized phage protein gp47/JayE